MKMHQHLVRMLKAFSPGSGTPETGLKPKHVIISAGFNDRSLAQSTLTLNLKEVVSLALERFKGSKIYLAQIRFSPNLDETVKDNICHLNKEMEDLASKFHNVHVIPKLPARKFSVGKDNIHWTENCANAMIAHYFQHLN